MIANPMGQPFCPSAILCMQAPVLTEMIMDPTVNFLMKRYNLSEDKCVW